MIDKYFSLPMTFDEMADRIGIPTLEDAPEFDDPTPLMKRFFDLVCVAPELGELYVKKYPGKGYKRISKEEDQNEMASLYTTFADGIAGVDWLASRKLTSVDWSKIIGTTEPVQFVLKTDGSAVYVRFIVGTGRHPTKVNQEIMNHDT